MSNIFSFVGKPAKKILCAMLSIILLIACIPVYANAASNGGFSLSIKWNGSGQDANLYTYDSTTPESRLVRLLVSYKNTRVSNGYDPGDIVITLPGISGAAREGTIRPDAIAADRAGSSSHNYDWSYTYASDTDTYTFTNNSAIDQNTAFEGSFEIIWNLDSRETIHNYAQTFQATMYTTHGEQLKSNTIRYTQTRSKDQYTVSETAAALYLSLIHI